MIDRCMSPLAAGALIAASLLAGAPALAQTAVHPALLRRLDSGSPRVAAWVFLRDKGHASPEGERAALADLARTYPAAALRRRALRRTDPGLLDARDLAVSRGYVDTIGALGVRVRASSRWLNAVSVDATREDLARLAGLPFVARVQGVRSGPKPDVVLEPPSAGPSPGGYAPRDFYGAASEQLNQINVPALHAAGFTGQGVIVGILDTGFRRDHEVFHQPGRELQVVAMRDFINDDDEPGPQPGDPGGQHSHGTLILGCLASSMPNVLVGGASDARYVLCKTEDISSETPVEEDYYVEGLEFAEFHGADLTTSSLGYIDWYTQADLDGMTAVTTIALNVAAANGVHACTAAGNSGHDDNPATSSLIAPADAPLVFSCGSGRADGTTSSFSSSGPTADGRLKPEVLARGSGTWTIATDAATGLTQASGTSLSTPVVAGAIACLVQAHPTWTVEQMRRAVFSTAGDLVANGSPDPLFVRGYGFVNALAASQFTCDSDYNLDGNADQDDVAALVDDLASGGASFPPHETDFNGDGNSDQDDVNALLNVVAGGACP